ncbi:DUF1492 domain-containing protein [Eremococcus coleocola]|uniref:DUF1492 domain-containing protein n=1 Tax=Eremococcus coleocola TaxID=88132 RepID=UPI0004005A10|nr:DUF1492 domain-containing protein [Eremococcus coleocola]
MEVKEYLQQLFWMEDEVKDLINERILLNSNTLRVSKLKDVNVQSSQVRTVEDTYLSLIDFSIKIQQKSDELLNLKIQISSQIDEMHTPEYRRVLRYRYLMGFSWKKVAEMMGYDERHIYRIHGNALQEFKSLGVIPCQ